MGKNNQIRIGEGVDNINSNINIGKKIMEFRKEKNLTIKELAQKSGLTSSLLSQIERNLANPSINSLKLIGNTLEVPMFEFFIGELDYNKLIVRREDRKKIEFAEAHNVVYELLSPNFEGKIEFANMILKSEAESTKKYMEHDGEELALVTEGRVNLHIEREIISLSEGDSIRIPPKIGHRWTNPYGQVAEVVMAIASKTI